MKIQNYKYIYKSTQYRYTTQQYSFLWRYPCSSAQFFVALLLARRRRWRGKTEWRKISREINECGEYVSHRVHMWKSDLNIFHILCTSGNRTRIYFKSDLVGIVPEYIFQILYCENRTPELVSNPLFNILWKSEYISEILLIWNPYLEFGPMTTGHWPDQTQFPQYFYLSRYVTVWSTAVRYLLIRFSKVWRFGLQLPSSFLVRFKRIWNSIPDLSTSHLPCYICPPQNLNGKPFWWTPQKWVHLKRFLKKVYHKMCENPVLCEIVKL